MALTLKDLFVGKTDAKNELMESSSSEVEAFKNGFLMPDNVIPESFFKGERYYITGLKGTGKTALLRYLSICVDEQEDAFSSFILFKSDIKEDRRTDLETIAEIISRDNDSLRGFKDYENPWMLFLFQKIVKVVDDNRISLFQNDNNWKQFRKLILTTNELEKKKGSIFPKITRGKVALDAKYIKAELDMEFESKETKGKPEVDFYALINDCESLYESLVPSTEKLYLFIDELELILGTPAQYQRDIELIRDLILAIDRINRMSRRKQYGVYCITGVRQEVLDVTQSSGKEINKPIADFGIALRWQQFSGDDSKHPLIKIIQKRLIYAEQKLPIESRATDAQIWERYFPKEIDRKPIRKYILDQTWYRPRDIVRILGIAQQQFPNEEMFSVNVFDSINKNYSVECWTEQEEELRTKYSRNDIKGIKHILMGLSSPFTYQEIHEKAEGIRGIYDSVNSILMKYKLGDILSHLFRLGIIGNAEPNAKRFSFRGDQELLIEKPMMIHRALWNVLSVVKKSKRQKQMM